MSATDSGSASMSGVLRQFRDGGPESLGSMWGQFFPRLVHVARKALLNLPSRQEDADDAAQSAMISFWKKLQRDEFLVALDRNSLWKLLATITIRKARKRIRRERAQKRGGGKVVRASELLANAEGMPFDELLAVVPSQEFDLQCEHWLQQLDEENRRIAVLRLFGHTNAEIAQTLDCTERRIERKLKLIRETWSQSDSMSAE